MRIRRRFVLASLIPVAALAGAPARAQSEWLLAPITGGPRVVEVEDGDRSVARAWLDELPRRTPLLLRNRVIVAAASEAELREALEGDAAHFAIEPISASPGFFRIVTRSAREAIDLATNLNGNPRLGSAQVDVRQPKALRSGTPDDPRFSSQWHLKNELAPPFDVNVEPVWQRGYTGAGVVIGIVEQRWQHNHPDLAANFNAAASMSGGEETNHATSVAGVAAAVAFNGVMGSGAAYGAQISNQIHGDDSEDAAALGFRNDLNAIKNNSWGPIDQGIFWYLPPVVEAALAEGVRAGRDGLGTVFVWAAGNGAAGGDRVDYDPYASSRYVIAVGAIGDLDSRATYTEDGSSLLVVAQSSGNDRGIYTTAINGQTNNFGGTSSAAPLLSGVTALMLEANPSLTWRDVKHILVHSARKNDASHNGWAVNGAGHDVNLTYGFGAVDADAAVTLAESWQNVANEVVAGPGVVPVNVVIPDNTPGGVTQVVTVDRNLRVESVELVLNVDTPFAGDLRITLMSPHGTSSLFAKPRFDPQDDLLNYKFTSVRNWDETSRGEWAIEIQDRAAPDAALWVDYDLRIYGTPACPGDLDDDDLVGISDLALLLSAFGGCEADGRFEPAADFDNNKCVDLADLERILAAFGSGCAG